MVSENDALVIALERPVRVLSGSRVQIGEYDEITFNGTQAYFEYPRGISLPDVLYDEASRTFVGLTFGVSSCVGIEELVSRTDERVVRLRDKSHSVARELYFGSDDERWLEVLWSEPATMVYAPAQLANVAFWLAAQPTRIVAMGLWDIHYHLSGFDLAMPDLSQYYPELRIGVG